MRLRLPSSRVRVALVAGGDRRHRTSCSRCRATPLMRRASGGRAAPQADWTCPMHPDVHQSHPGHCPICGMTLERKTPAAEAEAHGEAHESRAETANPARPGVVPPVQEDADDPRAPVEIDTRRQQLLGVRLATAEQTTLSRSIHVPGIVRFDESRWTDITLRFEGYVRDLYVDRTGQAVRRGQPLFTVYSPDLASSLAEYRLAVQSRTSLNASAVGGREGAGGAARRGGAAAIGPLAGDRRSDRRGAGFGRGPHGVPLAGVGHRDGEGDRQGHARMPGDVLYRIVDPSVVWVEASVYEPDLGVVRVGQHGAMTFRRRTPASSSTVASPTSRPPSTPSRGPRSCGSRSPTPADGSRRACSRRWI